MYRIFLGIDVLFVLNDRGRVKRKDDVYRCICIVLIYWFNEKKIEWDREGEGDVYLSIYLLVKK